VAKTTPAKRAQRRRWRPRCAACGQPITRQRDRVRVVGAVVTAGGRRVAWGEQECSDPAARIVTSFVHKACAPQS